MKKLNLKRSIILGLLIAVIAGTFTVVAYYSPLINAEWDFSGLDDGLAGLEEGTLEGSTVSVPTGDSGDPQFWDEYGNPQSQWDDVVSQNAPADMPTEINPIDPNTELGENPDIPAGGYYEYDLGDGNGNGDITFNDGSVVTDTTGGGLTWEDVYESPEVDFDELTEVLDNVTFSELSLGDIVSDSQFDQLVQAANGNIPGLSSAAQHAAQLAVQSMTQGPGGEHVVGNPGGNGSSGSSDFGSGFGSTLPEWVKNFYIWALGIAGSLATLVLIYAGYLYATSAGNPEQVNQAKEYIIGALAGVAFLLLAVIIYNTIKVGGESGGGTAEPGTITNPSESGLGGGVDPYGSGSGGGVQP